MPFVVQDRGSWQFISFSPDGGEIEWTPRVDRAARFLDREEAVFAGLEFCDLCGFLVQEVSEVKGPVP